LQVGDPAPQRAGVVLAYRLQVTHLEPGTFQQTHGGADRGEFAVREDIGVDEPVDAVAGLVGQRAPRDLVVQEPSAGSEQRVQVTRVLQVPGGADVFGHAYGGDRVVRAVGHVTVVLDADLHPAREALVGDAFAGVGGLLGGECDAGDVDAVGAGGV